MRNTNHPFLSGQENLYLVLVVVDEEKMHNKEHVAHHSFSKMLLLMHSVFLGQQYQKTILHSFFKNLL